MPLLLAVLAWWRLRSERPLGSLAALLVVVQIALGVASLRLSLSVPAVTVAHQLTAALLVAVLYLGGWGFPLPVEWIVGLTGQSVDAPLVQVITATTGIVMTVLKAYLLVFFAILLRWTVPRVRIDQLLDLGWKFLLPIALVNLLGTAGLKLAFPAFFGG